MTEIIYLIDPNDINLDILIEKVNRLQPKNCWIGCSVSTGAKAKEVFDKIRIEASLFPGSEDQIRLCKKVSKSIFLPIPLFCRNLSIAKRIILIKETGLKNLVPMDYVLLNGNSTAAKIFGVNKNFTDTEILKKLEINGARKLIYLEGGSRNKEFIFDKRKELITRIKEKFPDSKLICGGGFNSVKQIKSLFGICDFILVSHLIHHDPEKIERLILEESQLLELSN